MALIKCHECGNDVSSEAQACPKCGAAPQKEKSKKPDTSQNIAISCLVIGILMAGWMEYMDFNRIFNAIVTLLVMGNLYGGLLKLFAADKLANSKKL